MFENMIGLVKRVAGMLESDDGTGNPDNDGLDWWLNGDTGLWVSTMNLIDSGDI